ncbi:MAG: hypothetical protein PHN18_05790 [Sulfurospirillaceae bacterium]|nr:hypothetical protein [Sulfurospirillaceae bacterium]MDD2825823.1 hypothetical protein [Sulfurospirillaceae bacterium]
MRKGFGLIQALIVIVMISGIMAIAMKYATLSVKQTSDAYAKESAELFMDSAVELTLLAISGQNRAVSGCLKDVNITSADGRYMADVNISTYYLLGESVDCSYCGSLCTPIQTEESHGMVMLEVVVETNATHPKNLDKQIRLIRRTLQRP